MGSDYFWFEIAISKERKREPTQSKGDEGRAKEVQQGEESCLIVLAVDH